MSINTLWLEKSKRILPLNSRFVVLSSSPTLRSLSSGRARSWPSWSLSFWRRSISSSRPEVIIVRHKKRQRSQLQPLKNLTYSSFQDPYRLVAESGPTHALPKLPSRPLPSRLLTEGGPPPRSGPCSRQPRPQFGRSTFSATSPFSLHPTSFRHTT